MVKMNPSHMTTDHDACGVGLVAQIGGAASREIVERALEALIRLAHRGGVDADGRSGDGAGLLTALPEKFIRKSARHAASSCLLSLVWEWFFCHRAENKPLVIRSKSRRKKADCSVWVGVSFRPILKLLALAPTKHCPPSNNVIFVSTRSNLKSIHLDFESLLFHFRKSAEAVAPLGTYFCSLSSRTVVYKGLLTPSQLPAFYCRSARLRVRKLHSRFFTSVIPPTPNPAGPWLSRSVS